MRVLASFGWRLAVAGGWLRAGSVAAGNAIAVFLLLLSAALPAALFPDSDERARQLVPIVTSIGFLLLPAIVLLVTVGRLSSGVRDRRLASVRAIGLTPWQARVVAAVENGILALGGAVLGLLLFLAAAPLLGAARLGGLGPLPAPLRLAPAVALGILLGVVVVSILVGTAPTWNRESISAARSEATHRRPSPWRLLVLVVGVGMLAWVATRSMNVAVDNLPVLLFLAGMVLSAVGIALTTPLLTELLATLATRVRRSPAVTLAGRSVQADAASSARVVAGLGVAVFVVTAGFGFLGMNEAIPHLARAIRSYGEGPQGVTVMADEPFTVTERDELAAIVSSVPGVLGVLPTNQEAVVLDHGFPLRVFVGTCHELELELALDGIAAEGCDDGRAALIAEPRLPTLVSIATGDVERPLGADLAATGQIDVLAAPFPDDVPLGRFDISGPTITLQRPRRVERAMTEYVAFVPQPLAAAAASGALAKPPASASFQVVTAGGTEAADQVIEWARLHGLSAEQLSDRDWQVVQNLRTVVYTLSGVALTSALLALALTAADRAMERRRSVARQVMVGAPGNTLRVGQLLQVLAPVVISGGTALLAGAIGGRALANIAAQGDSVIEPASWAALVGIILIGALLVALATLPLIRTRLTPELLRRE